jgi:DNA invertase Pin-like site-specific DNA recombinase
VKLEFPLRSDKLIVMNPNWFARTAKSGFETVKDPLDQGITVHVLNMGLVDNTPTGCLILQIMLNFVEFEREMIKERTAAGKAICIFISDVFLRLQIAVFFCLDRQYLSDG